MIRSIRRIHRSRATTISITLITCVLSLAAGCKKAPAAVDAAPADAAAEPRAADPGIDAVYDAATPPDPRATALCDALYDAPAQKKAACCREQAGPTPMSKTCAGVLSSALALGEVRLDEDKAKACAAARATELDGCAWVGAISPPPTAVCNDILSGSLRAGARCRSHLECAAGLRCQGASALDVGRCALPAPIGSRCGGTIDGLSVVVSQVAISAKHPECTGGAVCIFGKCMPTRAGGEACRSDLECGTGNRCELDAQGGACVAGRIAIGTPCKKSGCVDGARCMDDGSGATFCQALRTDGESCVADFDCARGGCQKAPGAAKGTCGMRCTGWQDLGALGRH